MAGWRTFCFEITELLRVSCSFCAFNTFHDFKASAGWPGSIFYICLHPSTSFIYSYICYEYINTIKLYIIIDIIDIILYYIRLYYNKLYYKLQYYIILYYIIFILYYIIVQTMPHNAYAVSRDWDAVIGMEPGTTSMAAPCHSNASCPGRGCKKNLQEDWPILMCYVAPL